MKKSRRPSLKEIAAATGVSARVVAAVLAGDETSTVGYSAATRDKVLEAARRLGYQRNRTARWLRQGRHGSIGIVAETEYVIPMELLDGMLYAARQRGLFLVQDRVPHGEPPMFFGEDSVDGVICFSELSRTGMEQLRVAQLPVVWVNTNRRRGTNVVTYDERGAAQRAAGHLRERGWRHPAYIAGADRHYSTGERVAGIRSVAAQAPVLTIAGEPWLRGAPYEEMVETMCAFLEEHARVDGIITANSLLLPMVYEALKRRGQRVGEDVGVVTFGWLDFSIAVDPNATAMALNLYDVGSRIIDMMETIIRGGQARRYVAPYALVERASTQPRT